MADCKRGPLRNGGFPSHSARSAESVSILSLQWSHSEHDGDSNHRRFARLFRRGSKKTSNFRVTGLCGDNPPVTDGSLHNGSVTRKIFPFDDVIMMASHATTLLICGIPLIYFSQMHLLWEKGLNDSHWIHWSMFPIDCPFRWLGARLQ